MKNIRLIGLRRRSGYVLFSSGGRAVKKREARTESTNKDIKALATEKIIDYATLQAWYNENKAAKAVTDHKAETRDTEHETQYMENKQRYMKFMLL